MVEHYPELIGIVLLLVFAATMFYQGAMIMRGKHGYFHMDHEKKKMNDMRRRVEGVLKDK
jgi:ABC-type nickel/cobalt efflux system permease component RcnA